VIVDTRPRAREPLTILRGLERTIYEACDAVASASSVSATIERAGFQPLSEAAVAVHLGSLVERGLILREGPRYLALAVAVGDYVPSADAARALVSRARRLGRREGSARAAAAGRTPAPSDLRGRRA